MPSLEVLMSAMYQKDLSLAKQCEPETDVLLINQCDEESYCEELYNGHKIRMISTKERGISNSRNMAIKNAVGDICIICDDDEKYHKGYRDAILKAYDEKLDADIIAFNVEHINPRANMKLIKDFKRAGRFKTYGAWCLTFKREVVLENNIQFNTDFGPGSGKIMCGEESVWQYDAKKKGLHIYEHPFCIAEVAQSDSTWFNGYNEQFFYDKGAFLQTAMPKLKHLFKYYYVYRLKANTTLSIKEQLQWINRGIMGIKEGYSYEEYNTNRLSDKEEVK